MGRRVAVLAAAAALAAGYEAEEHKLLGDLGSTWAAAMLPADTFSKEAYSLVQQYAGSAVSVAGDNVRLISVANLAKLIKTPGPVAQFAATAFYPRERALESGTKPLIVWSGTFDKAAGTGNWFTFGDLVAIYGDLRRIITCGANDVTACTLVDNPKSFDAPTRQRYREFAVGWDFVSTTRFAMAQLFSSGYGDWDKGTRTTQSLAGVVLEYAATNHWHFTTWALKWYIAMHREALVLVHRAAINTLQAAGAAGTAKIDKMKAAQRFLAAAMHYEAHAVHSLTDLHAPGHISVDRMDTSRMTLSNNLMQTAPFVAWQDAMWERTFPAARLRPDRPARLRGVAHARSSTVNTRMGSMPQNAGRAKAEQGLHAAFNLNGAKVRPLKRMGIKTVTWVSPHNFITSDAAGHVAFGDTRMSNYGEDKDAVKGNTGRGNPHHTEWGAATVMDSVHALLTAYRELRVLKSTKAIDDRAQEIMDSVDFYDALGDIPIQVANFCYSKENCYAPDTETGKPKWLWVPYADAVLNLLKIDLGGGAPTPLTTLPYCTGRDATDTAGYCFRKFDGATTNMESDKVAKAVTDKTIPPPKQTAPFLKPTVDPKYRGFVARFADADLEETVDADERAEMEQALADEAYEPDDDAGEGAIVVIKSDPAKAEGASGIAAAAPTGTRSSSGDDKPSTAVSGGGSAPPGNLRFRKSHAHGQGHSHELSGTEEEAEAGAEGMRLLDRLIDSHAARLVTQEEDGDE